MERRPLDQRALDSLTAGWRASFARPGSPKTKEAIMRKNTAHMTLAYRLPLRPRRTGLPPANQCFMANSRIALIVIGVLLTAQAVTPPCCLGDEVKCTG